MAIPPSLEPADEKPPDGGTTTEDHMEKTVATENTDTTNTAPIDTPQTGKGAAKGGAKTKPTRALPEGVTEGGKLYKMDPHKARVAGHDEGCDVAVTDPLYDERAKWTDEQADIDTLATSLDASDEDVLVDGVVRDGEVYILKGRRRTRASRKVWDKRTKAGKTPPNFFVVIRSGSVDKLATAAFVENFGRMDDPPILLANKIKRHMDSRGWDIKFVSALMNASTQTVKNTLSLLKLCPELQNAVETEAVSTSVGYELARLNHEKQLKALHLLQEAAKKRQGKIRKIDATNAVAIATGRDPEEITEEDEDPNVDEDEVTSGGGKGKKKGKGKKSEPKESKGPSYEPINPPSIRRLLRAVEKGEITDAEKIKGIKNIDGWTLLSVIAGIKHISQAPGLSAMLGWAGVKRA